MIQTIVAIICEIVLQLIIIEKLAGKKKKFALFSTVIYSGLCFSVLWGVVYYHKNSIWNFINYIFSFIYIQLVYQMSLKRSFLIFFISSFMIAAIELILLLPAQIFLKNFLSEETIPCVTDICALLSGIFLVKRLKKELIDAILETGNEFIKVFIILCFSVILYGISGYKIHTSFSLSNYFLFVIFIVTVSLLIVLWQKEYCARIEQENEWKFREIYEKAFEELIIKIQSRQHEFDNHLAVLKSQIFICQSYEELKAVEKDYMKELKEYKSEFYDLLRLKNPILAGLLYTKFCKAKELEIHISYEVSVCQIDCAISMCKIVEVLSILLDNAIEKLAELETEKRQMIVCIEEQEGLNIEIRNRAEYIDYDILKKFFEDGYTTKEKGRGLGLYHLKNIVSANKGKLSIRNEEKDGKNYICICVKLK